MQRELLRHRRRILPGDMVTLVVPIVFDDPQKNSDTDKRRSIPPNSIALVLHVAKYPASHEIAKQVIVLFGGKMCWTYNIWLEKLER